MLNFNFLQYVFFTTGQHFTFIISLFNHQLPLKVIEQLTLSHDEKTSSSMLGRRRWSLEMQTCLRVKEWLKTKWSFTTWRKLWWIRWDSMMWESRICWAALSAVCGWAGGDRFLRVHRMCVCHWERGGRRQTAACAGSRSRGGGADRMYGRDQVRRHLFRMLCVCDCQNRTKILINTKIADRVWPLEKVAFYCFLICEQKNVCRSGHLNKTNLYFFIVIFIFYTEHCNPVFMQTMQ